MAKVIFFGLCLLFSFLEITKSAKLNCKYEYFEWQGVGNIYYCWVQNKLDIISPETAKIDSESGSYGSGKGSSDVKGFWSDKGGISYLPSGLQRIYPNLIMILVRNGRIKEIHQSDLKQYPKLVYFSVHNNDIEVLEDGLFDYNPDLAFISFHSNKLCYVSPNIFDHLTKLRWIELGSNDCINEDALNSLTAVEKLVKTINKNTCDCPGYTNQKLKFDNLQLEFKYLEYEAFKKKLERFELEFKSSRFSYFTDLQKKLDDLKLALEKRYKEISIFVTGGLIQYDTCSTLRSKFISSVVSVKDLVSQNTDVIINACNPTFGGKLNGILNHFNKINEALAE